MRTYLDFSLILVLNQVDIKARIDSTDAVAVDISSCVASNAAVAVDVAVALSVALLSG